MAPNWVSLVTFFSAFNTETLGQGPRNEVHAQLRSFPLKTMRSHPNKDMDALTAEEVGHIHVQCRVYFAIILYNYSRLQHYLCSPTHPHNLGQTAESANLLLLWQWWCQWIPIFYKNPPLLSRSKINAQKLPQFMHNSSSVIHVVGWSTMYDAIRLDQVFFPSSSQTGHDHVTNIKEMV